MSGSGKSASSAKAKLEQIKIIVATADGWEDGETFYESALEEIREVLADVQGDECGCGAIDASFL